MKQFKRGVRWLLAVVFFPALLFAAEQQPAVIAGNVILIKTGTKQILVAHKRPGAFVDTISAFKVDEKTQLANFDVITELKLNDPVTVSYVETDAGNFTALQIERNQQEGEKK